MIIIALKSVGKEVVNRNYWGKFLTLWINIRQNKSQTD